MNSAEKNKIPLFELIEEFVARARDCLEKRWDGWEFNMDNQAVHEVVGGLLARQISLTTQMAMSPGIWNNHSAPIFLRCMVDIYINLCWISKDPLPRSQKFLQHGLGEWKLSLEHRKEQLRRDGKNPDHDELIKNNESLLNSQRYTFLINVDLGHWAEMNTRKLAEEAGCIDFYNYAYTPFSAAVHSTWRHLRTHNLQVCSNPLHKAHLSPIDYDTQPDPFYLDMTAKYLDKSLKLFDDTFNSNSDMFMRSWLHERFSEFDNSKDKQEN